MNSGGATGEGGDRAARGARESLRLGDAGAGGKEPKPTDVRLSRLQRRGWNQALGPKPAVLAAHRD